MAKVHNFGAKTKTSWHACAVLLLLLALLAPSSLLAQQQPLQQPSTDVTVNSAADFLTAMGTPSVLIIRFAADIVLSADAVIPGTSPSCGAPQVYQLTRNVTLTVPLGMDGPTDWRPAFDTSRVMCVAPPSLPDPPSPCMRAYVLWQTYCVTLKYIG